MTIVEAGAALRRREISCAALTEQCLQRIEALNARLNAFMTVTADAARARACRLDRELADGHDRGPLHGIPIAHKDIIRTKGVRTTSGSLLFADYVPDHDATVVERLDAAGCVTLGKTGMHELAYGVTSENPHYGVIRNPHDPERIPGGSSGGSGSAVAAGMALLATGTDTGGSIRIPASFCGITGLKPTYGLVSSYGVQPLGLSLDHIGPMTLTARDAAIGLEAIAGYDSRDPVSVRRTRVSFQPPQELSLKDLRIGLPENFYFDGVAPEAAEAVRRAARHAESLGARVIPVMLPDVDALNAAGRIILLAEVSAIYRSVMHRRELFGEDVFALFEQGMLVPAPDYVNAQRVRRALATEFRETFERIDCLFTPTTPTAAPRIGERLVSIGGSSVDIRLASTLLVRGINLLGFPAISVPAGRSPEGLPLGLQIIAAPFREDIVLNMAAALETGTAR